MWIHGLRDNLLRPPNWPMAQVHIETDDGTSCWTAFRSAMCDKLPPIRRFFLQQCENGGRSDGVAAYRISLRTPLVILAIW
jgi:hypothetical protein